VDAQPAARTRPPVALLVGGAVILGAGIVYRFLTRSDLWLDEALTVDIARLPLRDIAGALKHDGAPPLYYVLLHVWMAVFGGSDVAVRSLSGVCSVAAMPVMWLVGRRLGGPRVAWPAVLLLAANPFAIRYATENRMYALVVLEAALGILFVQRALDEPTVTRLVPAGLLAAALLYTHYWALYLLAGGGLVLLVRAWHHGRWHSPEARLLVALVAGSLLWLPWLPTFLFQAAHTGTPWATPAGPSALINLVTEYAGGGSEGPRILGIALTLLIALGTLGRPIDSRHVEIDLRGQRGARPLLGLLIGAPAVALAAGLASNSAFIPRYTSIVLPVFLMLAGIGMSVILDRRIVACLLAALCALGFGIATSNVLRDRTQAGQLAGYLATAAKPGDVVAFCPDQLGPASMRLLGDRYDYVAFPRGTAPRLIDWVDYEDVTKAASPAAFAKQIDGRVGPGHSLWLITSGSYRSSAKSCAELSARLLALRPLGHIVVAGRPGKFFESADLVVYPSEDAAATAS
jgi:mannosyltransferase